MGPHVPLEDKPPEPTVETLRAAQQRIAATLHLSPRRLNPGEQERAARLLADLWAVFAGHRISDDSLRDVVSIPCLALDVIQSTRRLERVYAAIVDGPWSEAAGQLTSRAYDPIPHNPLCPTVAEVPSAIPAHDTTEENAR